MMIEDDSIEGSYHTVEIPPFHEQEFVNKDEEFILASIKKNGKITAPWVAKHRKISANTARRILNRLEENGIIKNKVITIRTATNGTRIRLYTLVKKHN